MSSTVAKPLIDSKVCEIVATDQYTVPASTRTKIDRFTVTNTTGLGITIDVHLVPPGGSAGSSNLLINAKSIAGADDVSLTTLSGQDMAAGSKIVAKASSLGLVIRCSGRETS